jgi:hypothetical protein
MYFSNKLKYINQHKTLKTCLQSRAGTICYQD